MCRPLFLVLLFCAWCAHSHTQTSLLINVVDSATNEKRVLPNLHLIKDGRTKIVDNLTLQSEFLIDKLAPGKWVIRYDSYFFNFKEVIVDLIPDKQNTFTIFIGSINSNLKNQLLLDQLKENDSLSFIITSDGCFHSRKDTLKIKSLNGKRYAYNRGKTKELDALKFATLRIFEAQIHLVKDDGCTTVSTYQIFHNNKKSKRHFDGSCDWDFGERITNYLFPASLNNPQLSISEE